MKLLKWIRDVVLILVLVNGLSGCGTTGSSIRPSNKEINQIQNVSVLDFPERTEIIVEGNQPLNFTGFSLTDPIRYVVDIPDTLAGKYNDRIPVNQGSVTSIVPIETTVPNASVRLEIGLMNSVEPQVRKEGLKLFIEVPKGVTSAGDAPPVPAFGKTDAGSGTKPEVSGGERKVERNVIDSIRVSESDQTIDVRLEGEFSTPNVFKLKGNRLVVDIPGATQAIRPAVQKINLPPVKTIRIGQHPAPKKVRIVLDMTRSVTYSSGMEDHAFVIHLNKPGVKSIAAQTPVTPSSEKESMTAPPSDTAEISATKETPGPPETAQMPEAAAAEKEPATQVAPAVKRKRPSNVLFVETASARKKYVGERIYLNFQDADIANVLRIIADVSGYNFVIGDEVKGKVNLKLKNVPWDQALDLVLRMNNLGKLQDGNIIRIASLANITKQQDDELKAKDSTDKTADLVTQIVHVNYATAATLMDPLKKAMSNRGDLTADMRTNSLIIKDIEKNTKQVADLIRTLDTATPQVQIESRIIQTSPTYERSLGVQWSPAVWNTDPTTGNQVAALGGITNNPFPLGGLYGPAVNLPAANPIGAATFAFGRLTGTGGAQLDLRISAGEARELVKIISTPKISVLDNQEATIQQGESIPYATTSASGTQTTFVDANLILSVKPHVTSDGSVIMQIKTSKNSPGSTRSGASGPSILKKEASTNILVKDGETAVIGGIYENTKSESTSGVPVLSQIPIIGWLFKNNEVTDNTSELMVFLTPRIQR
ncbi:MAG TPA: type IV pilus secretin PilQ [Nitrospiria bacterium]|nr:type IV pilus secretin PilQ [Nitrospiria bacterium]